MFHLGSNNIFERVILFPLTQVLFEVMKHGPVSCSFECLFIRFIFQHCFKNCDNHPQYIILTLKSYFWHNGNVTSVNSEKWQKIILTVSLKIGSFLFEVEVNIFHDIKIPDIIHNYPRQNLKFRYVVFSPSWIFIYSWYWEIHLILINVRIRFSKFFNNTTTLEKS